MSNLFYPAKPVDFWVWINPKNILVKHQITFAGGFTSGGLLGERKSNLMFIPNPDFQGDITPFQFGIMREYVAEYNLELCRERSFRNYPSRLNAIYFFISEEDSFKYKDCQPEHVQHRNFKKVPFCYSLFLLGS